MMNAIDADQLRSSKENGYGTAMLIVGPILWLLFIAGTFGIALLYVLFGFIGLFIAQQVFKTRVFGDSIMVTDKQFPEINAMVVDYSKKLGLDEVPKTFVMNSGGISNALAARFVTGRFIVLYSGLIDIMDKEMAGMVIGHELGHHAAGHLSPWKSFLRLPAYLVPFLGAAYSRAREFTADRIGATCLDDMAGAKRGLTGLACGSQRLNKHVDSAAFVQQDAFVPPFIGFLVLIFSGYPRLTQRVMALDALFAERPALASPSFGVARAPAAVR